MTHWRREHQGESALNTANARWFENRRAYDDESPAMAARRWERQERATDRAMWFMLAAGVIGLCLMIVAGYYLAVAALALPWGFWLGFGLFLASVAGFAWNIWIGDDG